MAKTKEKLGGRPPQYFNDVKDMEVEELKKQTSKMFYENAYIAMQMLRVDIMRSRDQKTRMEACKLMLEKLSNKDLVRIMDEVNREAQEKEGHGWRNQNKK